MPVCWPQHTAPTSTQVVHPHVKAPCPCPPPRPSLLPRDQWCMYFVCQCSCIPLPTPIPGASSTCTGHAHTAAASAQCPACRCAPAIAEPSGRRRPLSSQLEEGGGKAWERHLCVHRVAAAPSRAHAQLVLTHAGGQVNVASPAPSPHPFELRSFAASTRSYFPLSPSYALTTMGCSL